MKNSFNKNISLIIFILLLIWCVCYILGIININNYHFLALAGISSAFSIKSFLDFLSSWRTTYYSKLLKYEEIMHYKNIENLKNDCEKAKLELSSNNELGDYDISLLKQKIFEYENLLLRQWYPNNEYNKYINNNLSNIGDVYFVTISIISILVGVFGSEFADNTTVTIIPNIFTVCLFALTYLFEFIKSDKENKLYDITHKTKEV